MDNRIGAQLYTVREFCGNETDFESTLKKIHDIGYKVIQISAIGDIEAEKIKAICDKYEITIACTHKNLADYRDNIDKMIEYHKTIGTKIAGLGYLPDTERKDKNQILELIKELNQINKTFNENGLRFAYHNHAFEFVKYDGKSLMDYFIENGKFDFILDVYWISYAGINPASLIKKLGSRCKILHYKDLAMNFDNTPKIAEVGCGNLDWDSIIEASGKAEFALVEQDTCETDPFECLKTSYDYLTKKGFV